MIKWNKEYNEHTTMIDGYKVDRIKLQSGKFHYYVCWMENIDWAAPHSKMSYKQPSLSAIKRIINRMKRDSSKFSIEEYRQYVELKKYGNNVVSLDLYRRKRVS